MVHAKSDDHIKSLNQEMLPMLHGGGGAHPMQPLPQQQQQMVMMQPMVQQPQ